MNNSQMKNRRIRYIDVLRGIGIILVVIGHLKVSDRMHEYIYSFHMPLFFFLGGLVYKKRSIVDDVKKRFTSLMVPYFLWGIIYYIYYYCLDLLAGVSRRISLYSILLLFSGEYGSIEYNKTLWFLPCYFIVTVLYNIIVNTTYKYFGRRYLLYVQFIVLIMAFMFLYVDFKVSIWGSRMALRYILFYFLGNAFSIFEKEVPQRYNSRFYMFGVAMICGILHICLLRTGNSVISVYITPIFAIFAWMLCARILERYLYIFELFGARSMDILCTENMSSSIVQNVSERMVNSVLPLIIEVVGVLLLCLLYAYIKNYYVKKMIHRFWFDEQ